MRARQRLGAIQGPTAARITAMVRAGITTGAIGTEMQAVACGGPEVPARRTATRATLRGAGVDRPTFQEG